MTRMIQAERERQGLTRARLARKAEMSASTVGQIESGYIGTPYSVQLEKLAAALQWAGDPRELVEEVEDRAPNQTPGWAGGRAAAHRTSQRTGSLRARGCEDDA
ncbi:MAG: helix-turn-helix transcriptional regulator [Coriobacteriia bacterium]|nr:helix-turn-helix transcriptional regulator [Coriobacteriia bacterium]